ncbi:MAG: RDD family protein [Proteobacteria bacterium]|nr:RDD family protein [Pseudomonadota bacterium]
MSAQNSPPVWRHMLALLYDTFLIIPLIMAANALLMAIYVNLFMNFDTTQEILLPAGAVQVVVILCIALFYWIFWRRGGQTLGMQAWRIKLVSNEGAQLTTPQIALRLVGALLSGLILGILWKYLDRDGYYWHDRLSKTHLILLPAKA